MAAATIATGRNERTAAESVTLATNMSAKPPIRVMACDMAAARADETVACTTLTSEVNREVISPVLRESKNLTGRVMMCW